MGISHLCFLAVEIGLPDSKNEVSAIPVLASVVSFLLPDFCLLQWIGLIHSLSKSKIQGQKPVYKDGIDPFFFLLVLPYSIFPPLAQMSPFCGFLGKHSDFSSLLWFILFLIYFYFYSYFFGTSTQTAFPVTSSRVPFPGYGFTVLCGDSPASF